MTKQEMFLREIEKVGSVTRAAELAGVDPWQHWGSWAKDPDYMARFEAHRKRYAEVLEAELHARAVVGWDEPVYQQGMLVGQVHKKSDALLALALRGVIKHKYSERVESHNINANLNATVPVPLVIDVSRLNADELRALEVVAAALAKQSDVAQPAAPGGSGAVPPLPPPV